MAIMPYPDDREDEPVQLTLSEFIQEGVGYYNRLGRSDNDDLTFLKFILAGRRGLDLDKQRTITLNVTQAEPDILRATTTRDYDSLIGTTRTLPYLVPLTVWPIPSFRDTLKMSNHVTSVAYDRNGNAIHVPMHSIPNLTLGKVTNRSAIRVFFPRMYPVLESKKIPTPDLESIYNRCLCPAIRGLMPNQATHWPPNYRTAMETSQDRTGRLHLGSLDIPAHVLHDFCRSYLNSLENLGDRFKDAYFGHELRGWKAATVHNLDWDADEPVELGAAHEHVVALEDLTRVLDMEEINQEQWLIDVGLEFRVPGMVVTWRTLGHEALAHFLLPDLDDPGRALLRSKKYYVDHQMHFKDLAGFRWSPGAHSDIFHYIQAYTTEKAISYQLHNGIFSHRKPSELLSKKLSTKLISDLEQQSEVIHTCTGDAEVEADDRRPHEGCARLEVRVCLANVHHTLACFPRNLLNQTVVQIPARYWWYFKWLRLAAIHNVLTNLHNAPSKDRSSDSSLALGAMMIWILNGAHRTPVHHLLALAK
ncbi:hypothetical protein J3R82DRAFT_3387 [Butyriboletus roseoflavus]|nr:hypothetical protein J3R82DRAFT_6292 [Butyriboletus roseoflavus]KAG8220404.1 hypothetical protein J3R82DRAFT_3387 [Butyriboletus roseoflavus]